MLFNFNYKELYHNLKDKNDPLLIKVREEIVQYAIKNGNSAASKKYKADRKTVRKWLKRFLAKEDPKDRSKSPKNCPHKIKKEIENKIISHVKDLLQNGKRIVPAYIKNRLKLSCSAKAVTNCLKRNNLYKNKKKKQKIEQRSFYQYKQMFYLPFEKIQIDVKYLTDIKEFKQERVKYKLGKYIYSARCVKSGFVFINYADKKSKANSVLFIKNLFLHLKENGVELEGLKIQTDNGAEFGLNKKEVVKENDFISTVKSYGAIHNSIPLGAKTWQSDVEIIHRLIEDELYATEIFTSKKDYIKKSTFYLNNFNLLRKNKHKENRTPWEIIKESSLNIKQKICYFNYDYLDDLKFS